MAFCKIKDYSRLDRRCFPWATKYRKVPTNNLSDND